MSQIVLKSKISHDEYTNEALKSFDVPFSEESEVIIENNIEPPEKWNIGLIYGPSGSGKSTLLKSFGKIQSYDWNEKPIICNLNKVSPAEASKTLSSVGLSSIPAWLRPFHCLSNGEQFRANLARTIVENDDLILIDEFTSVVDRNVAKSASFALQKFIRKNNKKVVLVSCHADIIDWVQPDWIYNPTEAVTHVLPRGSLRRPEISLKIFRSKYEAWDLFKHHHYLSSGLNKSAKCFLITWNDVPVGFAAVLAFPHAKLKNAWRASRTVILPDFQGLGIGVKIGEYIGSLIKFNNGRYYSRTTHPAMINYRLSRPAIWRVTGKGVTSEMGGGSTKKESWKKDDRFCYSFEYIGPAASQEESRLFWEQPEGKTAKCKVYNNLPIIEPLQLNLL